MDRQKKEQAIELLMEYQQELEAELETTKSTIRSLSGQGQSSSLVLPRDGTKGLFPSMSFQDIILDFLKTNPDRAWKASEIARHLSKQKVEGHEKKSFRPKIHSTVRRLVSQGKAIQTLNRVGNRKEKVAFFQFYNGISNES